MPRNRYDPPPPCPRCVFCSSCQAGQKYGLTVQELRLVRMIVGEAAGNQKLARNLQISEETVKRHLSNIMDKMGCDTRLQLALLALGCRLVENAEAAAALENF